MGVPASEVGYTPAMPRREDHEVRKGHVEHWIKKKEKGERKKRSQLMSLEFFIDIKSFRSYYGPGGNSASNRNEYQEHFRGVKTAGGKAEKLTTILCHCHEIWEP